MSPIFQRIMQFDTLMKIIRNLTETDKSYSVISVLFLAANNETAIGWNCLNKKINEKKKVNSCCKIW